MPKVGSKRLFIAIEIPEKIKNTLCALVNILKESSCDARWINYKNIHLTLKFLGTVEAENVKPISQAVISALKPFRSMSTAIEKIDGFPSLNAMRVLIIKINDQNKYLKNIVSALENALVSFGFNKEAQRFQAHLTLARLKSNKNSINLIEKINKVNQTLHPQKFTINRIALFESRLTSQGPVYSCLQQIDLMP